MRYYEPLTHTVSVEEEGLALRTVLQRRFALSRRLLSRLKLTERGIAVNGQRTHTGFVVAAGDLIEIRMEEENSEDILPQDIPVNVIYEDDHLLVVNKPAGLIVHPTTGHWSNTLANGVVQMWLSQGLRYRFRPIHRLDQETSGVLAVAKNPYVHQHVSQQMSEGTVDKAYTAIVRGEMARQSGTVDAAIDRDPDSPHRRIVTDSGYPSITHYQVLERYGWATLLSVRLETGRTHQIRVHMAHLGHPIICDSMYGDLQEDQTVALSRHALHASTLSLQHPISKKRMTFHSPLPEDMKDLLSSLQ